MSFVQIEAENFSRKFPDVDSWMKVKKFEEFQKYVQFYEFKPISHTKSEQFHFNAKRKGIHRRILDDLGNLQAEISRQVESQTRQLGDAAMQPVPAVDRMYYDSISDIMTVREYVVVQRKRQKCHRYLLTRVFEFLSDHLKLVILMAQWFAGNLIPDNYICTLDNSFRTHHMAVNTDTRISKLSKKLLYLKTLENKLKQKVDALKPAIWRTDFNAFLKHIIAKGMDAMVDRDVAYIEPIPEESSLSRCLFNPYSGFRRNIDRVLRSLKSTNPAELIDQIGSMCYTLMVNRESYSIPEQSVALLMLFRVIFNRCYELNEDVFTSHSSGDLFVKVERLGLIPAVKYSMPWELMKTDDVNIPIGEYFRSDKEYARASDTLYKSTFASNPIDALYAVHRTLVQIHRGALVNKYGEKARHAEDGSTVLCFDDLFALFFGTLLASDIPDLHYISKLTDDFAPKSLLSPPFEYAQANTEALVLHVIQLNLEQLQK